jgi:hypothetical protein
MHAVIGIDMVELNLPGGSILVLHDVQHVPKLSRLLISMGQLDEAGIPSSFSTKG